MYQPSTNTYMHYTENGSGNYNISGNVVKSLCEDHTGMLWAGTYTHGLNELDKNNNRVRQFVHKKDDPASLGMNNVWVNLEVSRNQLWIGLMGGGLDLMNRERAPSLISGIRQYY